MDKKCFLMMLFLWLTISPMLAQPHLSQAFDLKEEWTLDSDNDVLQPQGMVGCVEGDILYCCHRRGFHNKENGFRATICAINLSTGTVTDFSIPLPEKKANAATARRYWIRCMGVEGNRLFVSVQSAILVYQKGRGNRYEFVRRIPADLPDCLSLKNGKLATVERVPEEGRFILKQQGEHGEESDSVIGLQLPGPFMLQYEPNGFVHQSGNAWYFLASPELRIEKYSLEGKRLAVICPQLPAWKPIPDELVQKISAMPYGSDRAMYTFFHTKTYSFPLAVCPLSDSLLMLSYHQYDTMMKKEQVLTALVRYCDGGEVLWVDPYSHFFAEDSVINGGMFPLYYAQRELCLQVADGERLVQIVREAPVEWRGRTGRAYTDSVDRYFADGLPAFRVRVANLRTGAAERRSPLADLGLRTYEGNAFTGEELLSSKAIFILNNPPQCHSCEENLFTFVSTLDTTACNVCVVFNNADGYMAKRDLIENARKHLRVPFTPLFVLSEEKEAFLKTLNIRSFPLILLKEAGETEAVVIPNEVIFSDNPASSELQQGFVRKITRFLNRKGGVGK